ncbi:MAG: hypothetical protein OEW12_02480 [Deltaproteobacteria bacterium]|nr:hypothetical protein [Deltaproteobacteria bacterium]
MQISGLFNPVQQWYKTLEFSCDTRQAFIQSVLKGWAFPNTGPFERKPFFGKSLIIRLQQVCLGFTIPMRGLHHSFISHPSSPSTKGKGVGWKACGPNKKGGASPAKGGL